MDDANCTEYSIRCTSVCVCVGGKDGWRKKIPLVTYSHPFTEIAMWIALWSENTTHRLIYLSDNIRGWYPSPHCLAIPSLGTILKEWILFFLWGGGHSLRCTKYSSWTLPNNTSWEATIMPFSRIGWNLPPTQMLSLLNNTSVCFAKKLTFMHFRHL